MKKQRVLTAIFSIIIIAGMLSGCQTTNQESGGDEPPWWDGFDFGPNLAYSEEYQIASDSGEHLNAAEAAKLTFDTMRDKGFIPEYSDDAQYMMVLVDLTEIEGEECYIYRLDIDDEHNNDGTLGAAYAYARRSGNIYIEGQMSQWVIPE